MNVVERRAVPRAATSEFLVRVDGYCLHKFGYANDISSTGMKLRTFTDCEPFSFNDDRRLRLEFILPGKDVEIGCYAEPVWREQSAGGSISTVMQGVRFTNIDPAAQVQIYEWVVDRLM